MSDQEVKSAEAVEPTVETEVQSEPTQVESKTEAEAQTNEAEDKAEKEVQQEATADKPKDDKSSTYRNSNMLKTTGRIDKEDYSKNTKFDPNSLPETSDPVAIRTQVEFYFGDSNLPEDEYMRKLTGGEKNEPVPIKKLCEFKRMRRFQPYSAVVSALKDSTFLEVEGEDESELVKRKNAWDPNKQNKIEERSVYVKGFGDEEPTTQFDIEAFFAKFGPTKSVRLRRTPEKFFKGSVFVEFEDKETATKFLEHDPKPQWKDHDLRIMWKKEYVSEKAAMIRDGKIQPHNNRGRGRGNFRGRGRGSYSGDSNDWKKRREHDQKNGFRDGGRGRGRGRGRGGRGRGGHDKGPVRDAAADELQKESTPKDSDDAAKTNGKRSRDSDPAAEAAAKEDHPAKKVDTKESTETTA